MGSIEVCAWAAGSELPAGVPEFRIGDGGRLQWRLVAAGVKSVFGGLRFWSLLVRIWGRLVQYRLPAWASGKERPVGVPECRIELEGRL